MTPSTPVVALVCAACATFAVVTHSPPAAKSVLALAVADLRQTILDGEARHERTAALIGGHP